MKYNNIPCNSHDGKSFQSKLERNRYEELAQLQKVGDITELATQVPYRMVVNGSLICTYEADFTYYDSKGRFVVEDAKSTATKTPTYNIKKKLLKALYGIDIHEVFAAKRKMPTGKKVRRS